jgi:hypothetical protein
MADKLQISWDDLSSESVEKKLKEQEAVSATQAHYEHTNLVVPETARRFGFFYSTVIYLSLFGALGGILGWGFGELLYFRPDQQKQAIPLIAEYEKMTRDFANRQYTPEQIEEKSRGFRRDADKNPYFRIAVDPALTADARAAETDKQLAEDERKSFIAALLFYGVSGVAIAIMLAIADSVVDRNLNGAIIYGSIGAVVGLIGGLFVAVLVNRIQAQLIPADRSNDLMIRVITQTVCWGLLGLFLAATPGLILRNGKRLMIGMLGGLIGGAIGGLIYVPVQQLMDNEHVSRLIAIVCIGLISGLACGIIENVVKTGWLKVESGLITGKQFVLYRNPTFIGAHPMSHIYLFNDPQVGRRHACIHIVGKTYEIEDLPLGTRTYVNDKPVSRQRLKNGDKIRVGNTQFFFQERAKS